RAMCDNPIHVHCFGAHRRRRERRLQRFFHGLLAYTQRKGLLLGAFDDSTAIGIVGALAPGACHPATADLLRLTPTMLASNTPPGLLRTSRWLITWLRADPSLPHWHLGPLAVLPVWQGRGVGPKLGRQICQAAVAAESAPLYLETDTTRNVRLHEAFGFAVIGRRLVLGMDSWLMLNDAPAAMLQGRTRNPPA